MVCFDKSVMFSTVLARGFHAYCERFTDFVICLSDNLYKFCIIVLYMYCVIMVYKSVICSKVISRGLHVRTLSVISEQCDLIRPELSHCTVQKVCVYFFHFKIWCWFFQQIKMSFSIAPPSGLFQIFFHACAPPPTTPPIPAQVMLLDLCLTADLQLCKTHQAHFLTQVAFVPKA